MHNTLRVLMLYGPFCCLPATAVPTLDALAEAPEVGATRNAEAGGEAPAQQGPGGQSGTEFLPATAWLPLSEQPQGTVTWTTVPEADTTPPILDGRDCQASGAEAWCRMSGETVVYAPASALIPLSHRVVVQLEAEGALELSAGPEEKYAGGIRLSPRFTKAVRGCPLPVVGVIPPDTADTAPGLRTRLVVRQTFAQRGLLLTRAGADLERKLSALEIYISALGQPLETWQALTSLLEDTLAEDSVRPLALRSYLITAGGSLKRLEQAVPDAPTAFWLASRTPGSRPATWRESLSALERGGVEREAGAARVMLAVVYPTGTGTGALPARSGGVLGRFSELLLFSSPPDTLADSISSLFLKPARALAEVGTTASRVERLPLPAHGPGWPRRLRARADTALRTMIQDARDFYAVVEACNTGPQLLARGGTVVCAPVALPSAGVIAFRTPGERHYARLAELAMEVDVPMRELSIPWNDQQMRLGLLRTRRELARDLLELRDLRLRWNEQCTPEAQRLLEHLRRMVDGGGGGVRDSGLLELIGRTAGRGGPSLLSIPASALDELAPEDCTLLQDRLEAFLQYLESLTAAGMGKETRVDEDAPRGALAAPATMVISVEELP